MSGACAECLRRGFLVGHLAPSIARVLDGRGRRRAGAVLSLPEAQLIAAVASDTAAARARQFLKGWNEGEARAVLTATAVEAVCGHSAAYPPGLGDLEDAPATLFVAGGLDRLSKAMASPGVTIVGARRASAYGLEVTRELGRGVAAAGLTVISGLALGVDAAAHRGALEAGGTTIAVLAGGTDVPYPRLNRGLYRQLLENGPIVSELPPGQRPYRWSFPARNRIMAALGRMTVVTEARDPSGSLITTDFALDLGRVVGAVPGQVTAAVSQGPNRLLRDGSALIRDAGDVIDELFGADAADAFRDERMKPKPELPDVLARVLEAIESGVGLEAVAEASDLSARDVRAALGKLELLGLVTRHGVGAYERAAGC
ncbi:MAG: DNA-protecting protein DprA [Thermoleophilaceae bacterium]|nr:DNA-protecting protein DprA [Thermoleophilaceae bacterium]